MQINTFKTLLLSFFLTISFFGYASENEEKETPKEEFVVTDMIMHHIKDAHDFHILDWKGHAVSFPLPVILWTDNGLVSFMSSAFHHDIEGKTIVEKKGLKFVNLHEKIYQLNGNDTTVLFDDEHHATNAIRPLDLSITKNVFSMFLSIIVLLLIFLTAARSYKKSSQNMPSGIARFMEPIILFIKDEVAIPNIGEKKEVLTLSLTS